MHSNYTEPVFYLKAKGALYPLWRNTYSAAIAKRIELVMEGKINVHEPCKLICKHEPINREKIKISPLVGMDEYVPNNPLARKNEKIPR